jgi:hypothetical protein
MKNHKRLLTIAYAFLVALLVPACHVAGPSGSSGNPTITYVVSGGFVGGIHTRLTVSPTGSATLETNYPQLKLQLTPDEYSGLLRRFDDFGALQDTFPNSCMDGFIFTVQLDGEGYSRHISIDQCTLQSGKDSNAVIGKLNIILIALDSLADEVYETKAPWVGLTGRFYIDSDIYGAGEPITLRYHITNPTSEDRAIYFQHQDQFWFSVYRYNFPPFYYSYPGDPDSSAPSEIHLAPGETKEIAYVWDQHVQPVDTPLAIGYYELRMGLLAGNLYMADTSFEVIDRSIPISGVITPDPNGESSSSSTYTFALSVRNWTGSPVTLHFPSSHTISVELYDLGGISPRDSAIYVSPPVTDSVTFEMTIPPHAVRTFTSVVFKSEFAPWYMWTYAKIRLLCTDYEFGRDGQLRMFPVVKSGSRGSM